jgi:uncharacterized membrane protein
MSKGEQQTITPERQMAAMQVGAIFSSIHDYLRSLEPLQADPLNGSMRPVLTEQLKDAHKAVDIAAMWAVKSVLNFGVPPRPEAPAPAEESSGDATLAPAEAPSGDATSAPAETMSPDQSKAEPPDHDGAAPIDLQTV